MLPAEQLLERAWELARQLARRRYAVIRHTCLLHTHLLRKLMLDVVPYGLALEGLEVPETSTGAHQPARTRRRSAGATDT